MLQRHAHSAKYFYHNLSCLNESFALVWWNLKRNYEFVLPRIIRILTSSCTNYDSMADGKNTAEFINATKPSADLIFSHLFHTTAMSIVHLTRHSRCMDKRCLSGGNIVGINRGFPSYAKNPIL